MSYNDFLGLVPYLRYFLCFVVISRDQLYVMQTSVMSHSPVVFCKQAFSWCRKVPKHGAIWVWLQEKADVLNPGVELWQANSNCVKLHGNKVCQSTPWWHMGGGGWCIPPHILNLCTIWGCVVGFTTRPLYPRERNQGTIGGVNILCRRGVDWVWEVR